MSDRDRVNIRQKLVFYLQHKQLHMVCSNSPDILLDKTNKNQGFGVLLSYTYDLLVILVGYLVYYLLKQEPFTTKLKDNGLKCNIKISFFDQTDME